MVTPEGSPRPRKRPVKATKPRKSTKRATKRRGRAVEDMTDAEIAAEVAGGPNRQACDEALADLEGQKRLEGPRNRALAQAARTIASQLDSSSSNSQMFREYREIWRDLVADGDDNDEPDDLSDLPSAVRDASKA